MHIWCNDDQFRTSLLHSIFLIKDMPIFTTFADLFKRPTQSDSSSSGASKSPSEHPLSPILNSSSGGTSPAATAPSGGGGGTLGYTPSFGLPVMIPERPPSTSSSSSDELWVGGMRVDGTQRYYRLRFR